MEKEIWKDIKGYEGVYQCSSIGRIKRLSKKFKSPRLKNKKPKDLILKQQQSKNSPYKHVGLSNNGKVKIFTVHQLVAICFLNHVPSGFEMVVDHIDNNSLNNSVANLQIVSNRHNTTKEERKGSSKYVGVSWSSLKKRWRASIRINGKNKHLGYKKSETEAHLAYQKELNKLQSKQ